MSLSCDALIPSTVNNHSITVDTKELDRKYSYVSGRVTLAGNTQKFEYHYDDNATNFFNISVSVNDVINWASKNRTSLWPHTRGIYHEPHNLCICKSECISKIKISIHFVCFGHKLYCIIVHSKIIANIFLRANLLDLQIFLLAINSNS